MIFIVAGTSDITATVVQVTGLETETMASGAVSETSLSVSTIQGIVAGTWY